MFREECGAMMPHRKFWLMLGALALGFLLVTQTEAASRQETWVLQQVAAGQEADLKKQFGDKDEDRTLSAHFLEDLLTGAYKVQRKGVMIKNAVIAERLDLELAQIPHSVDLTNCHFQKEVSCRDAVFEKHFMINGSHFEKEADCHRLKVNLDLFCRDAVFQGPVNFGSADIKKQFGGERAQFQSKDNQVNEANFNSMKVGQHALFENAIFQGPVDFGYAVIEGGFDAVGARFQGQGKDNVANFAGMKVSLNAFFDQAKFQGPVDFASANIDGHFSAKEAQFQSKENQVNKANFNRLKVGQSAHFENAIFQGTVDFVSAKIEGVFVATGAQFQGQGKDNEAIFFGMKVGQHAFFNDAEFHGPVDLSFCNIQALQIPGITLPKQKDALNLEGLIYKSITAGDEPDDWKKLLALVDQARYHAQPYSQLETFLKESGYPDRANEVFIAKNRRELKETWHWWDYWKWPFEKVLLDWGVGYGRHPQRAFGLSVLCIILGTLIFSRPGVLSRKGNEPGQKIKLSQAFWFSFEAFLPFIRLGPVELYEVERERRLSLSRFLPHLSAQTYFYLHQLAGYILVAIALAAVTGIIK